MSNTIDNKVVEMRFDNGQFEKGVSQTIDSVEQLKQSLNFAPIASSLSSGVSSISRSVETIASRFTNLGIIATTALVNIANQAVNTGLALVNSLTIDQIANGFAKYSQMAVSTQTIMSATRKMWADENDQMAYVSKQLERLLWFTDETSYSFVDMVDSIGKFTSAGISLDTAVTNIMGIATWAGLSGQNATTASRAMYQLAQAIAKGFIASQDWMSIETANMATDEFKNLVIDTAVELGTLQRRIEDDGSTFTYFAKETKSGIEELEVSATSFRTNLSEKWFTTDVLTKALDEFGKFPDLVSRALDRINEKSDETLYTTEFLDYIKTYKANVEKLSSTIEKFGMTETALRGYISDFNDGTLDMEATASKYEISVEDLTKELSLYKDGLLDLNEVAEEYGADVSILYGEIRKLSSAEYDLGLASLLASQESRTLEDSINYVRDAVSSGWMTTFNIIIGELLDAKKVFATVSNELYEIFVEDGEKRNEVLKEWAKSGGRSDLLEATLNIWYNIKDVIFAVKDGFHDIFPPATAEQLVKLTEKLKDFTIKFRLSEEQTEKIRNAVANFTKVLNVAWYNIKAIAAAISSAWKKIFPPKTMDQGIDSLEKFSEKFSEFIEKYKLTGAQFARLERTLQGVFAVLDIISQLIVAILKPLTGFDDTIGGVGDSILETTAKIGDWLVGLDETIKKEDLFNKAIQKVQEFFGAIQKGVDDTLFFITGKHLDEIWDGIKEFAGGATHDIGEFFGIFSSGDAENAEKESLTLAKIFEAINGWINDLKQAWQDAQPYLDELKGNLAESFNLEEGFDFDQWDEKARGLARIFLAIQIIYQIITELNFFFSNVSQFSRTMLEGLSLIIEGLGESLWSLNQRIKAGVITKIARSILYLAIAMAILAAIDTDKLGEVIVTVGTLFLELAGTFEFLMKTAGVLDTAVILAISKAFKSLAFAMLEIGVALSLVAKSTDDPDMLRQAGEEIAILFGAIGALLVIFDKINVDPLSLNKIASAVAILGFAMIEIAAALAIVVSVSGNPDAVWTATEVMVALLAAVAAFYWGVTALKVNAGKVAGISASMILLGMALILFASAIAIIASLGKTKDELVNAGEVLAGMLVAIGLFYVGVSNLNVNAGKVTGIAASMMIMGVALVIIASALAIVANLNPDNLGNALGALVTILVILGAGLGALSQLKGNMIESAFALTLAATGILILAYALKVLAESGASIDTIIPLGAALLVICLAGALAEKVAPGMYALATACAAIGVAALLAGVGMYLFAAAIDRLISLGTEGVDVLFYAIEKSAEIAPMMGAALVAGLAGFASALIDSGTVFLDSIIFLLETILEAIKTVIPLILEIVKQLLYGGIDTIIEMTPVIIDTIIFLTREILRGLTTLTPEITAAAMAILIDTLQQIAANIFEITYLITDIALKVTFALIQAFIDHIPDFIDMGWNFIISMINGMAEGIENHAQELVDAVTHFVEVVINTVCDILGIHSPSTKFLEIGGNAIKGFINGVGAEISNAVKKAEEFVGKFINKFKEKFSEITQVGRDMMNGFLNGISEVAGTIQDGAAFIADGVVNTFNTIFDINSPSKVFEKIGKYVDQGLVLGLKGGTKDVWATSSEVGESAIDGMSSTLSKLSDEINSDIDTTPTIRPVMDLTDVTNGVGAINGMLSWDSAIRLSANNDAMMNRRIVARNDYESALRNLSSTVGNISTVGGNVNNNTFNITGDNPKEIASEVSTILQRDVERRNAVWA